MNTTMEMGRSFIWENARMLDRAIFEYYFLGGSPDRVRSILRTYQTDDGGFGHALEPDLRVPDSQPIFVEFALRTLYDCGIRDQELAYQACDFISKHSDLARGIPDIFPSALLYPHAPHWGNPASQQPSMDRLVGLVGMVNWHGVSHPWLPGALEACLQYIATNHFDEAHIIHTAFCLIDSVNQARPVDELFDKLASELMQARFFLKDVPVETYGLTPLTFAPAPTSFCRRIFTAAQIEAHLDDLASKQQADGGWPILWNPPGEMARCEWRGQRTVQALATLHAYGRI